MEIQHSHPELFKRIDAFLHDEVDLQDTDQVFESEWDNLEEIGSDRSGNGGISR